MQRARAIGNQECIMACLVGLMSPRGLTSDLSAALKKPAWGGFGRLAKDGIPWILRTTSRVSRRRGGIERGQASWSKP